jgi:hypothetical protein
MGHLIPAGTGFNSNRNFDLVHLGEPALFEGESAAEEEAV